jgi:hypothetical protein
MARRGPAIQSFIPVSAWACAMCEKVHAERDDADECCRCGDCGEKFPHDGFGNTCDGCMYGRRLRTGRDDVKRNADHLRSSLANLRGLIENPPNGKQRPKKSIDCIEEVERLLADAERES